MDETSLLSDYLLDFKNMRIDKWFVTATILIGIYTKFPQ